MKGIEVLPKLKVLYIKHNLIKDWSEFNKLKDVTSLEELSAIGKHFIGYLQKT